MNHKIYDIKPTIIEASHDYKRNGENIEADRIIDLREYDLYHEGKIIKCKVSPNTIHPYNIESIIKQLNQ